MISRLDILYIEDEPHMIHLVDEAFEESSIPTRVHGVNDGGEARAFLAGEDPHADAPVPDLVLLDENLGAESGLELLVDFRAQVPPEASVVMFTTSDDPAAIDLAYERGANAFVQKPSDFEGLVTFARGAATFWKPAPANASA